MDYGLQFRLWFISNGCEQQFLEPVLKEQSNFKDYCKVTSSNKFRLEAHADFFRLLMKGIFDPYVLLTKKLIP